MPPSSPPQELAGALLAPIQTDGGDTLLHLLASGEPLGVGGGLLLSLAGAAPRSAAGGGPAVWPSKHQRGRAQVLALLLARQPRLALLAGSRNAAGRTPLHCCVLSRSWQVLALLLAALQQLLGSARSGESQQQHGPQAQQAQQQGQRTLQLLLSVPDASGLSPLDLAIRLRQWPAARLLAAAAGGGLPLSKPQLAACSLVQQYLGLARSSSGHGLASGSAAAAAGEQQSIHVSASGATVTEALGGLLSKLWDAFSATPGGEAAMDELAAAARLEDSHPGGSGSSGGEASGSSLAEGASSSRQQGQTQQVVPLKLQARAVSRAEVMVMVQREEQQAVACSVSGAVPATEAAAELAPAAGPAAVAEASAPEGRSAADACPASPSSRAEQRQCMVCYEDVPGGELSVRLRCSHATCDACWRGILGASIDEGACVWGAGAGCHACHSFHACLHVWWLWCDARFVE